MGTAKDAREILRKRSQWPRPWLRKMERKMEPLPEQWKHWEGRSLLVRLTILAAGAALGVIGTVAIQTWVGPVMKQIPEGLGDLVGGVATIFAALVGWASFTSWDTQKRKEKRAEVATTALIVTMDLHRRLDSASNRAIHVVTRPPEPGNREELAKLTEEVTAEPLHKAFDDAQVMLSLFLPPPCAELMEEFYDAARMAIAALEYAHYSCDDAGQIVAGDARFPFVPSTNNEDLLEQDRMKGQLGAFRDQLSQYMLLR